MDVTNLVKFSKKMVGHFFLTLFIFVCKAINEIDEMRMRLVNDKPVIYDKINTGFTAMTDAGFYVEVYTKFYKSHNKFYNQAKIELEFAKKNNGANYLPKDISEHIFVTSLPWISFIQMTHPIPQDKNAQTIPRICWGKYFERNGKLIMNLNIIVSRIFVDGYPLSKTFLKIQEYFDNPKNNLK